MGDAHDAVANPSGPPHKHALIRPATPADAPQISTLIGTVWSAQNTLVVPPEDIAAHLSGALGVPTLTSELQDPRYTWLVGVADDGILGIVMLTKGTTQSSLTVEHQVELQRVYLTETAHGSGLAGELVLAAQEVARAQGYRGMWLGVYEDNDRAKRFYRKMGFGKVGEKEFWAGKTLRKDWVMQKML